jgi:hypothetical protein
MYYARNRAENSNENNKTMSDPDSADDPEASADERKAHYVASLLKHVQD